MKLNSYNARWIHNTISPRSTECILSLGENKVGNGVAIVSDNDDYDKEVGRKLSLARALTSIKLPKNYRKMVWEAYRNSKKGGRW